MTRFPGGPMVRCIALFIVLSALPASAYTIDLPALPDPGVTGDALYARIDSLEVRHRVAEGVDRADLAARLGILYLATGLSSHEQLAQDFLREAIELDPSRHDAVYWSAIALQRSGYYTMARSRIGELLAREPDDLEHLLMLARLEFVESRLRYYKHDVSAAYQLYLRALALAPTRIECLIGTGSAALLVGNHQLARSCGERLMDQHPELVEGWYMRACANYRMGNTGPAWVDFLKAVSHADEAERNVFLGGSILVTDEDLASVAKKTISVERAEQVPGARQRNGEIDWVEVVREPTIRAEVLERWWMRRDPSPAAFENEGELEYWARLVEADLIFGRPEVPLRGWETLPGEVWMRLGRPLSQHHWLSENEADVQMREAPRLGGRSLAFAAPGVVWDWAYIIDGIPVTMRFIDESYGQPLWSVGPGSTVDIGTLRNEMEFVEPARHLPRGTIELYVSVARFARGSESLLETSISAYVPHDDNLALPPLESVVVEWSLMAEDGTPIDQETRTLKGTHRLSTLLAVSGGREVRLGRDPYLTMVGAHVDAGRYQVKVRAINPTTGVFSAKTFGVTVPESHLDGPLTLSSIQLAHGLPEWDRGERIPLEFIKHGRVVLSAGDAIIAGSSLGVFYELENLGLDETGQTQFDVEYAVYEATGQVRLLAVLGDFDPSELEEVELSTVQYLHERTGVSPEGLVVKGTEIDISALREGDYVLRIGIDDRLSGQECSSTVAFRRLAAGAAVAVVEE